MNRSGEFSYMLILATLLVYCYGELVKEVI